MNKTEGKTGGNRGMRRIYLWLYQIEKREQMIRNKGRGYFSLFFLLLVFIVGYVLLFLCFFLCSSLLFSLICFIGDSGMLTNMVMLLVAHSSK